MRNKLLLCIFSISTVLVLGTPDAKGAFAAEPHGDEHLEKYGQKAAFDASVPFTDASEDFDCSASRIKIGEDDSVDFYVTAAHCLEGNPASPTVYKGLVNVIAEAIKEVNRNAGVIALDRGQIKRELRNYLNQWSDSEVEAEMNMSKTQLISIIERRLETLIDNLSERLKSILEEDVDYVKHPKFDLAVFTTNIKTDEPRYPLYTGKLKDLAGATVTSVGFGSSMLKETNKIRRQAFDSTVDKALVKEFNSLYSEVFKPDSKRTLKQNPIAATTEGDSGGSVLIKEKGGYELVGTIEGLHYVPGYAKHALSIYEKVPKSLKSNSYNQECIQMLKENPKIGDDPSYGDPACYGAFNKWTGVDLNFIKSAKEDLLAKRAVYMDPPQTKRGYPKVTFELKHGLNEDRLGLIKIKEKNFIGYASAHAKLSIFANGEEATTVPCEVGRTPAFLYSLGSKTYVVQVAIEQATDGKNILVKSIVSTEEEFRNQIKKEEL